MQKALKDKGVLFSILLSVAVLLLSVLISFPALAYGSSWSQTNWSGGSGQTVWTNSSKYSTSTNIDNSAAGQITLSRNEELTNTGFESDLTSWNASIGTFLLQDEFTTDESAPLTSPRTCEPGPGSLTVTDTGNKVSISNGNLVWGSGTAWADPRICNGTGYRSTGVATIIKFADTASSYWYYGWGDNVTAPPQRAAFFSGDKVQVVDGSVTFVNIATAGTRTGISVLRSTGAFLVLDSDLVWVSATGSASEYAGAGGGLLSIASSFDYLRVSDLSSLASEWGDDYGIATDRKAGNVPDITTFTHEADFLLYFDIDTLPPSGAAGVSVRQYNGNNKWVFVVNSLGQLRLWEVVDAVYTIRGDTAVGVVTAGMRIGLIAEDETIRSYYNNTLAWTYSSATNFKTETDGLTSISAGGAISDLVTWPRTLSGDPLTALERASADDLVRTRDTSIKYAGTASAKLVADTDSTYTQSVNVGDTEEYKLEAYAYTDGSAVTNADIELFYNGSTISTTYTNVGLGWYRLNGTLTGAASARDYGVEVKEGKTVYIDNVSLFRYDSSGKLTSSVYDTGEESNYGTASWSKSGSVTVKVRTSNHPTMAGVTNFVNCNTLTNNRDISGNNCVDDKDRYIQYQLGLSTSDQTETPTFNDITFNYTPQPYTNIKWLGIIPVVDSDYLSYYFTSTTPIVKGETQPGSEVTFETTTNTFTTTADSNGDYQITLTLNKGVSSIEYYSTDTEGYESGIKELKLTIGIEYFPQWLLEKLGLVETETEIEIEEVEEEEEEEEKEEESEEQEEEVSETVKVEIQVLDEQSEPVEGALVRLHSDVMEERTNSQGLATFEDVERGSHRVEIEYTTAEGTYTGEKELNVTDDTKDDYHFEVTMKMEKQTNWFKVGLYFAAGVFSTLAVLLIIGSIKRSIKRNSFSDLPKKDATHS